MMAVAGLCVGVYFYSYTERTLTPCRMSVEGLHITVQFRTMGYLLLITYVVDSLKLILGCATNRGSCDHAKSEVSLH